MEATSSSCQCIHTVLQHSKTNLKAGCYFTSDASLQQVNCTSYSCWCCRSQEELPTSFLCLLVQNGFRVFPCCPLLGAILAKDSVSWSHNATEDLPVAVPFTRWVKQVARYDTRRNSPPLKQERIGESLCLSSEVQRAPSVLFRLTCFLVLHRCRMTAILLISDPVAYSGFCDLCRY